MSLLDQNKDTNLNELHPIADEQAANTILSWTILQERIQNSHDKPNTLEILIENDQVYSKFIDGHTASNNTKSLTEKLREENDNEFKDGSWENLSIVDKLNVFEQWAKEKAKLRNLGILDTDPVNNFMYSFGEDGKPVVTLIDIASYIFLDSENPDKFDENFNNSLEVNFKTAYLHHKCIFFETSDTNKFIEQIRFTDYYSPIAWFFQELTGKLQVVDKKDQSVKDHGFIESQGFNNAMHFMMFNQSFMDKDQFIECIKNTHQINNDQNLDDLYTLFSKVFNNDDITSIENLPTLEDIIKQTQKLLETK